jgi:hypothetical protein
MIALCRPSIVFSILLLLLPTWASANPIDKTKANRIQTLLAQTSLASEDVVARIIDDYFQQLEHTIRLTRPDIGPTQLGFIHDEVSTIVHEKVIEQAEYLTRILPIYDALFTVAELEALIAFNQTPIGLKWRAANQQISQQTEMIIEELTLDMSPDINDRLLKLLEQQQDN